MVIRNAQKSLYLHVITIINVLYCILMYATISIKNKVRAKIFVSEYNTTNLLIFFNDEVEN